MYKKLITLTFALFLCAAGAFAQKISITGSIFDDMTDAPITGAAVTLYDQNQALAMSFADANGQFAFELPTQAKQMNIEIKIKSDGYLEQERTLRIAPNQTSSRLGFRLKTLRSRR